MDHRLARAIHFSEPVMAAVVPGLGVPLTQTQCMTSMPLLRTLSAAASFCCCAWFVGTGKVPICSSGQVRWIEPAAPVSPSQTPAPVQKLGKNHDGLYPLTNERPVCHRPREHQDLS
jgi:hypothetical protein